MGRIIDIEFNGKPYVIEYDRYSVLRFMEKQQGKGAQDNLSNAINLVACGLLKHHANGMPSDDEILGMLLALGDDLKPFTEELSKCLEEVITSLKGSQEGNLKWGVRK